MPRPGLLATMRVAGGGALSATCLGAINTSDNLTTYAFGAPAGDDTSSARWVVAACSVRVTGVRTVVSATIGGQTATVDFTTNSSGVVVALVRAEVPSGTAASVTVVLSGGGAAAQCFVWQLSGAVTVSDTDGTGNATNTAVTATVTGVAGGVVLGVTGLANYYTALPASITDGTIDGDVQGAEGLSSVAAQSGAAGSVTLNPNTTAFNNGAAAVAYQGA